MSTRTGLGPLCFQAGCRMMRLNLALVFLCLFCRTFLLIGFVVLGLVFPYQADRLAWGTSP